MASIDDFTASISLNQLRALDSLDQKISSYKSQIDSFTVEIASLQAQKDSLMSSIGAVAIDFDAPVHFFDKKGFQEAIDSGIVVDSVSVPSPVVEDVVPAPVFSGRGGQPL